MKKIYVSPLMEVTQVHLGAALLDGSPTTIPGGGPSNPTPGRRIYTPNQH